MATGVLKVRVGGAWVPIGSQGSLPAHAIMHMAGGADALLLDTLAAPTDVATLNATTSAHGLLPKLSGNASLFLNGVGAWGATGDVVGPAAAVTNNVATFVSAKTIQDSGLALSNIPRLNAANAFTAAQTVTSLQVTSVSWGSIGLTHSDAGANLKNWQLYGANGSFVVRALSDNWATQYGYLSMDKNGNMGTSGTIQASGNTIIGLADGVWPSLLFNAQYFTFNHTTAGQLAWLNSSGVLQLNMGDLRFNPTTFKISNGSGTPVLTIRNDGVVTVPYFLVVPVGVDKWAPA
jgi:hypothetical protein